MNRTTPDTEQVEADRQRGKRPRGHRDVEGAHVRKVDVLITGKHKRSLEGQPRCVDSDRIGLACITLGNVSSSGRGWQNL